MNNPPLYLARVLPARQAQLMLVPINAEVLLKMVELQQQLQDMPEECGRGTTTFKTPFTKVIFSDSGPTQSDSEQNNMIDGLQRAWGDHFKFEDLPFDDSWWSFLRHNFSNDTWPQANELLQLDGVPVHPRLVEALPEKSRWEHTGTAVVEPNLIGWGPETNQKNPMVMVRQAQGYLLMAHLHPEKRAHWIERALQANLSFTAQVLAGSLPQLGVWEGGGVELFTTEQWARVLARVNEPRIREAITRNLPAQEFQSARSR